MALQYLRLGRVPPPPTIRGCWPRCSAATRPRSGRATGSRIRRQRALAYSAAVTDAYFSCLADRVGDGQAAVAPVYAYEFNDRQPPAPESLRRVPFPVGASHGLDLRYFFDIGGAPPLDPVAAAVVRSDDRILDAVRRHRHTGLPRCPGVAPAQRTPRRRTPDVIRLRRQPGVHHVRTGPPVRVLGDTGALTLDGTSVKPSRSLAFVPVGADRLVLQASDETRLLLLGGPPLGERIVMWWNFVGRDHDEIAEYRRPVAGAPRRRGAGAVLAARRRPLPRDPGAGASPRGAAHTARVRRGPGCPRGGTTLGA